MKTDSRPAFPLPVTFGERCSRWDADELARYDAAVAGVEPPTPSPEKNFLSARDVSRRYRASLATIWRWTREARAARERAA